MQFTEAWQVFEQTDSITVPAGETVELPLEIDGVEGVAQAFSVYIDAVGGEEVDESALFEMAATLDIFLVEGENTTALLDNGAAYHGTAMPLEGASENAPFQVPFIVNEYQYAELNGTWSIQISNRSADDHKIHGWRINAIVKPVDDVKTGEPPCIEGCTPGTFEGPVPLVDNFDGERVEVEHDLVTGTIDANWSVEVLDENGADYEVYKTSRSQTMSLSHGEIQLVRDFQENLGGRTLTLDYRFDGNGWFQVWADNQILITHQAHAQSIDSIVLPYDVTKIRVVIGSTDGSRTHEATLSQLSLELAQYEPSTCGGIVQCVTTCGSDVDCQQQCAVEGSPEAQTLWADFVNCANHNCAPDTETCAVDECKIPYDNCVN